MTAHPSASADVLIVGGGPAGASAAIRLARGGHRVLVIERDRTPRPHGYGALITPRALSVLDRLDVGHVADLHRIARLRLTADGRTSSIDWPAHPTYPGHAGTIRRNLFDAGLLRAAGDAGATILDGHEAIGPIVDRGFVRGAHVLGPDGTRFEARADYTLIADGANSRFGRALGTFRQPSWPYAVAQSATFRSALHTAAEVELVLDLRDKADTHITGYGWMFPGGDGTVNVGVLLMSTSASFQVLNPVHLHDRFVADHRAGWHLEGPPTDTPASGRIPLGLSVGPAAGPTYLLVGDAVGAANPLSGAGVDAALETGLLAADVLSEALEERSATVLQRYPKRVDDMFGSYYEVGRLANRVLGQPGLAQRVMRLTASRSTVAETLIRLATNQLRSGRGGTAELMYRAGRTVSIVAPDA